MDGCAGDDECHIVVGHCSVGLGGCHYALNTAVEQGELDALGAMWAQGQCGGAVCGCIQPPVVSVCDNGHCIDG
jgi:hypothetical protein